MSDKTNSNPTIIFHKRRTAGFENSSDRDASTLEKAENGSRRERRNALKEFYKLKKKSNESQYEGAKPEASSTDDYETIIENKDGIDQILKEASLKDLIALENKVHYKINSNKSLIKNIIYNNYFELIKINGHLSDMVLTNEQRQEQQRTSQYTKAGPEENPGDEEGGEDDDLVITSSDSHGEGKQELKQLGMIMTQGSVPPAQKSHILDEAAGLQQRLVRLRSLSDNIGALSFVR